MAEERLRRPILKRVAIWTAGILLSLASYVAGMPFVVAIVHDQAPVFDRAILVVYSPLVYLVSHKDIPGSDLYDSYQTWCFSKIWPDG